MLREPRYLIGALVVGLGATLLIDLWALVLRRGFKIPSLSYCLLGRWLLHMPGGTFVHRSIAAAQQKPHECTLGWVAHYSIGSAFALLFVLLVSPGWLVQPTLLPAVAFGVSTTLVPYLIMQPSFGLGVAASKTQRPNQARLKSLMTHTVFGIGLYLWAALLSPVLFRTPLYAQSAATSPANAQPESPTPLVGTWRLVSVDNLLPDGTRVQLYGPRPSGLLMLDAGGRYALQILSADRPGFASKDKSRGTPEEYRTAVQGSNAHFGTYAVDPAGGAVTFRIERASFPNWEGTEQRRPFTLTGDRLTYTVPAPTSGTGAVGEVVWRREP